MSLPQNTPDSTTPTRREFLKTSALAATGAVVGSYLCPPSVHAAGSDTLKVGLVGCGGRGSGAAVNALTADANSQLVAVADIFEDKLNAGLKAMRQTASVAKQIQVDQDHQFVGFDGYQKVLESDIDVVVIACTSRFHPEYLRAAVDAGKHIFIEKPHAIDPPGIQSVIDSCELARQKGLSVVSGLCWRYDKGVQATMEQIHNGAIGDIIAIQETYMRSPYHLTPPAPGLSEIEYQFRNWYHFNWLSGDDIAQSLIHSMDKGAWAMHDEPPVMAYGQGGRAASEGRVYGNVFDHFSIMYEYANGVRMYALGRAQVVDYNEVSDIFLGTKGKCDLLKHRIEGETNWQYDGPKPSMYVEEHRALFESIRAGQPINNGQYMVGSSMLAILGQRVAYTGDQVNWKDAVAADYHVGPELANFDTKPPVEPDEKGIYPVPTPQKSDAEKPPFAFS
jgi:myo-inositol 2-dehydrogenase/D-chiro-inositol 1-dehydrogenase